MPEIDFTLEDLLEQARGNQTAIWHLAVRWARQHSDSVDEWATFVGENFAPSWDELGDEVSAREVARLAALNIATTADMRPVELNGDDARAEIVLDGPEAEWTERMGTKIADLDRTNEVIFRIIAERRGMAVEWRREGERARLMFSKV